MLVNNYQLVDSMKEEARYAGVNRRDPELIRDDMYKKMKELDIPAKREDVHVEMIGPVNVSNFAGLHCSCGFARISIVPQFPPSGRQQFHLGTHLY